MARVKTGPYRRQHHKKVLKITKGQFGTRSRLFRRANEAMLKSHVVCIPRPAHTQARPAPAVDCSHQCCGETERHHLQPPDPRHEGIQISLNRKMLADLAVRDPQAFTAVVNQAQTR